VGQRPQVGQKRPLAPEPEEQAPAFEEDDAPQGMEADEGAAAAVAADVEMGEAPPEVKEEAGAQMEQVRP
jgi:hypothetical protein